MFCKPRTFSFRARLLLCLTLLLACFNLSAALIYVVNSESRTLSRIDTSADIVQNNFASLGIIPNKIVLDENYIWCVNSGDNAVQKIDRQSGATLANILVENSSNPWDACLHGDYLYVTGLFTNKVYKINRQSHAVTGSVTVGPSPEALCVHNGKLYVTNTGGYLTNYANSSVSVIDLASFTVEGTIPVSANPQYLIEHEGLLHVSCTGNWTNVPGAVCVISPAATEVVHTVALGGALGGIWIDGNQRALVGDGNGYCLYRYDAQSYDILNGAANPISPGGSVVWGDGELIALLYPNWGSQGKVRILHPDLSYWKEYTVGLAPTDMKIWSQGTSVSENAQSPVPQFTVYPNPLPKERQLTFAFGSRQSGTIEFFDIKGRKVGTYSFASDKITLPARDFARDIPAGFLVYKIRTDKLTAGGKVIVLD